MLCSTAVMDSFASSGMAEVKSATTLNATVISSSFSFFWGGRGVAMGS